MNRQPELFAASQVVAAASDNELRLHATLHYDDLYVVLVWSRPGASRPAISAWVRLQDENLLQWTIRRGRKDRSIVSHTSESAIRGRLKELAQFHPVSSRNFDAVGVGRSFETFEPDSHPLSPIPSEKSPWDWLAEKLRSMVRNFKRYGGLGYDPYWLSRAEERRSAELARLEQNRAVAELQRLEREEKRAAREGRKLAEQQALEQAKQVSQGQPQAALPPISVRIELPEFEFQETALPLTNLKSFTLQERASLWWVSNQTDSLLCLPYCRIERLDYQVRTALRVLGPLRGRALLSDEVGLGKTIEAGLVLKELLTRGMVKRFLVLTVPSLVDQWQEELADKFGQIGRAHV